MWKTEEKHPYGSPYPYQAPKPKPKTETPIPTSDIREGNGKKREGNEKREGSRQNPPSSESRYEVSVSTGMDLPAINILCVPS